MSSDLSREEKKTISRVWYCLMMKKKIRVRTVHDEILKEMLSESQLKDPKISEQVEKLGKYCIETKIEEGRVRALNLLEELRYVKKTNEKIYRVYLNYVAHLYVPNVDPNGGLGISVNSKSTYTHFDFYEDEYRLFFNTAREFKNAKQSGRHSHITDLNIGISFRYETEVYEVNDDFFDAMMLKVTDDGRLEGNFAEPMVTSSYNGKKFTESKNWKLLSEFTEEQFLKGGREIRKEVKKLSWKKEQIGIIEGFDKKMYNMQKHARKRKQEKIYPSPPNFFGRGLYSYENTMARIFEDAVSEYLRNNEHYHTTTRYRPSKLKKEFDVLGEKGSMKNKKILVCEIKLRISKNPITKDELDYFNQKATEFKQMKQNDNASFDFWFVTNTKNIEPNAKEFLHKTKTRFMVAKLPKNWDRQADWGISKISEYYKIKTRKT